MNEIHTTQVNLSSDIINFGIGQPGFDLLPLVILRQAADLRMSWGDTHFLNYGYELGDGYFRIALASFLEPHYDLAISPDTLMVTAGASQAIDLICTRFTQPGDVVFVAEPTYFLALRIFADHRLQVVSIAADQDGLIIDELATALEMHRPALLYTVPAFQNPTGATLSQERRQQLVKLAEEHDFLIVADEVYQLLDFGHKPPPPLACFIESQHVFSVGSFSKILAPGLRLGWIQAAPELLKFLADSGLVDSGGGLNPFTSNIVRVALEEGWQDEHLIDLKEVYKQRAARMGSALGEHLPDSVEFDPPTGGFFYWLGLPEIVDTSRLLQTAQKQKVGYQPGIKFSSRQSQHNKMRLSFAFYDEDQIVEGIARLGSVLSHFEFL
ncbi:MAG: PLP-dependent aminotransferase family protein [Candidatus Promineifilaceae bacterium]|nr:PLP-dependent aminotransferase family protein [Candidatus Promineifilaceae bacterium]